MKRVEIRQWHMEPDAYDIAGPSMEGWTGTAMVAVGEGGEALTRVHTVPDRYSNRLVLDGMSLLLKAKTHLHPIAGRP
jgi:hypothetical protein